MGMLRKFRKCEKSDPFEGTRGRGRGRGRGSLSILRQTTVNRLRISAKISVNPKNSKQLRRLNSYTRVNRIHMEAVNSMLSSPSICPPRAQLKHFPSSSAALVLHEQTSLAPHFATSVLIQEQREHNKLLFQIMKDDKTSQATTVRRRLDPLDEQTDTAEFDLYLKEFQNQLLRWPSLRLSYSQTGEACDIIDLAKKALSASREAVLLAEDYSELSTANHDQYLTPRSTSLADYPLEKQKIVRSTRHLERKSKRRGIPKKTNVTRNDDISLDLQISQRRAFDPNDPLGLFFSAPETKQILSSKEESKLIVHIQELMVLEEVKNKLCIEFGRDPTLVEWARVVGTSSHELKLRIRTGESSRDKLIYANFRMVVHIAKKYRGQGLSLQDLLQEGSVGLMRSVQVYKPRASCRFASYAYWWIRQYVRKAIFQHSRLIRLPANVYAILYKISEAKRLCKQEWHRDPTKEEIAARVGITVERLEILQNATRRPISLQKSVWADQSTTYQHITEDQSVEAADVTVMKDMMRKDVRNLLGNVLGPKERKVMRLRYGIDGGKSTKLSEIGLVLGLSRERIRQIEKTAMCKLKESVNSHKLHVYANLLA